MPNGNADFDLAEMERFFAPLAGAIGRFAESRNLAIQKYYHESPAWDLCFKHPIGGLGTIHLTRTPEGALHLSAGVWKDVYEEFTRYIRRVARQRVEKDEASLTNELTRLLDEILTWPFDAQFTAHPGYEREWSWLTKQQFEASPPHFPEPVRSPRP